LGYGADLCLLGNPDLVQTPGSETAAMVQTPHGIVVVYVPNERYGSPHEQVTRAQIACRLAALKGFDFADAYDTAKRHPGPVYIVPSDTLVGLDTAHAVGIHSEHDLFGGLVPYPFVATKAIIRTPANGVA
jgi:hypothetical protein